MLSRDLGDGGRTAEHKYPIIVGVDGSFAAIRAARWASAIAERFEAPLEIVHAVADRTAADSAVRRESTEAILQSAQKAVHVQFKGLQIAVRQLVGPADQTMIAASHAFRLIVLGTDELSSNTADFSGWATATVAAYSVCPVVAWRGDVISPTQQPIAWAWESSLSRLDRQRTAGRCHTYVQDVLGPSRKRCTTTSFGLIVAVDRSMPERRRRGDCRTRQARQGASTNFTGRATTCSRQPRQRACRAVAVHWIRIATSRGQTDHVLPLGRRRGLTRPS
jgi:nucleotide-binding universal stress UspA family protein